MRKRVLIVDDDPPIRRLLGLIAERAGGEVDYAGNGLEALDQVGSEKFDLVILDLMMPVVDGFTFIQEIRGTEEPPHVIVVSAQHKRLHEVEADFVCAIVEKPFDLEKLGQLIVKCLDGSHDHPDKGLASQR